MFRGHQQIKNKIKKPHRHHHHHHHSNNNNHKPNNQKIMIVARVLSSSSSVLLALLCLFTATSVVQSQEVCSPLIVRGIFNEGYITERKQCDDVDFAKVEEAIGSADVDRRRQLRSSSPGHRLLQVNCARICAGLPPGGCVKYGCPGDYDDDRRRALSDEQGNGVDIVVLDEDYFANLATTTTNNNGGRNLETCGISEEDCIEYKAKLYQLVLSALPDVKNECANLILSPSLLQCIVMTDAPATRR
jgi:hypothetical protein